ncbi:glycosyltransferase [Clostridium hydrogenum]|uniref:glycosyltransferase n=1 Tax=Clostridium hydrogenum TaxID=2855764 RepID=UPI001F20FDDA|nr:glycosyltransferase [Clostridium hydrogenum]
MKISLCMIVKNEEKYIRMCLENALKLADEAIIVDTGSTDKTIEIIKEFGDKVKIIRHKWNNDFSEARNISLENATGDWILMLDADEKLLCDPKLVRDELESSVLEGFEIPLYNIINLNTILYSAVYCKIFKNKGYRYVGAIHEQINIEDIVNHVKELDSNICKVIHYGYLESNVAEKDKISRNLEILFKEKEKKPKDPFVYYNIGCCYEMKGEYKKALKYFFKCNELTYSISKFGLSEFEIDMAKRMTECYYNLEEYKICIEFINDMIKDNAFKNFVDMYYMLGNCYFRVQEYDKAIENLNKCLDIGETKEFISVNGRGSYAPKLIMARIYIAKGEKIEAINKYMECAFDSNNIIGEGINEFRAFLVQNNFVDILNEFNKIIEKKGMKVIG